MWTNILFLFHCEAKNEMFFSVKTKRDIDYSLLSVLSATINRPWYFQGNKTDLDAMNKADSLTCLSIIE